MSWTPQSSGQFENPPKKNCYIYTGSNPPFHWRVQPGILRAEHNFKSVRYSIGCKRKNWSHEGCRWWIFCPTARAKTESSRVGPKVLLKRAQDLLARRLILSFPCGVIISWFFLKPASGMMLSNVNTGFPKVQSVSEHTPWKINILNPEVVVWKMFFLLFKQVIFRFHVNFPGCTKSEQPIPAMKWLTKLIFPHLLSTPRVLSTGCYPTIIQKLQKGC